MFLTRPFMTLSLLALLSTPAFSEDLADLWKPQDCLALTIAERQKLEAKGEPASRSYLVTYLTECRAANASEELALLKKRLETYKLQLRQLNLSINEKGQLIDQHNRVLGQLRRQNQTLELEIQASNARQQAMLKKAEVILKGLVKAPPEN